MVVPEHILAQDVWLYIIALLILVVLSIWALSKSERKEDERRRHRHVQGLDQNNR